MIDLDKIFTNTKSILHNISSKITSRLKLKPTRLSGYVVFHGNIYKILAANSKNKNAISFYNEETKRYLRHSFFRLVENKKERCSLFNEDSSFIPVKLGKSYSFYASNEELKEYAISQKGRLLFISKKNANILQSFKVHKKNHKETLYLSNINFKLNQLIERFDRFHPITAIPKAIGELREHQEDGVELLCIFDKICRENNIEYWIDFGTLLGAVRHGGYIPWDDDLDVSMMENDFIKFHNIADSYLKNSYITYSRNFHPFIYKLISNKGRECPAWLDIFPYYFLKNEINELEFKEAFFRCRKIRNDYIKKNNIDGIRRLAFEFNKEYKTSETTKRVFRGFEAADNPSIIVRETKDIFPLEKINFEGIDVYSPHDTKKLLKNFYGDYWDYPERCEPHLQKFKL